ncbi:MAG: hypothetical protein ACHWZW_07930 [Spirulina sp.]
MALVAVKVLNLAWFHRYQRTRRPRPYGLSDWESGFSASGRVKPRGFGDSVGLATP